MSFACLLHSNPLDWAPKDGAVEMQGFSGCSNPWPKSSNHFILCNRVGRHQPAIIFIFEKGFFLDIESLPKKMDLVKFYFPGAEEPGKFVLGLFMVNGTL